jgi:hypothetical protein
MKALKLLLNGFRAFAIPLNTLLIFYIEKIWDSCYTLNVRKNEKYRLSLMPLLFSYSDD